MTRPAPAPPRPRHRWHAPAALAALVLLLGGCDMKMPEGIAGSGRVAAGMARIEAPAPRVAEGTIVSAIRARPPGTAADASADATLRRVILVHGTPGGADNWGFILERVPPGFEFIAIDRPGFGRTRPGRARPSLAAQAAALEPFLTCQGGGWPILVGHSLGGPIVAQAAVDFPTRIGALVQIGGSLDPDLEEVWPIQYVGDLWPVSAVLPSTLYNSNRELIDLELHLRRLAPRLADVTVPVVILHGTDDTLVPYANVPFMQRSFVNASVETITRPGGDHFLLWNDVPSVLAAIVRAAEMARASPSCVSHPEAALVPAVVSP